METNASTPEGAGGRPFPSKAPARILAAVKPIPNDLAAPSHLLVVRLSALGDVIHCLPAIEALRRLWPSAAIDAISESLGASILQGHPALGRVMTWPRKEMVSRLKGLTDFPWVRDRWRELRHEVQQVEYDLVVDFQSNLRSAFLARIFGWHRRVCLHPADGGESPSLVGGWRPQQPAGDCHRVERNLHLVRALGYRGEVPTPRLPDFGDELPSAAGEISESTPPTLLHPFVSKFGALKEWPSTHFIELARRLESRGHRVLISGSPDDRHRLDEIVSAVGAGASAAVVNGDLPSLARLITGCRLVVAADTGVLHLAAAAGIPCLGLYGPKAMKRYGPWGEHARATSANVPCSPCTLRRCDHSICMQVLTPNTIEAQIDRFLGEIDG